MIVLEFLSFFLLSLGVILVFRLSPHRVAEDMMRFLNPPKTLKRRIEELHKGKRRETLGMALAHTREALRAAGEEKRFAKALFASVFLSVWGIPLAILIGNPYLAPVFFVTIAILPFVIVRKSIRLYDKSIRQEIETALSVITSAYLRSDNIVAAVEENVIYLKPPLKEMFLKFLAEVHTVSSNIPECLQHLKYEVENEIFREWVDTLIACQFDRTLKDTLMPIVGKLTDVRIANAELRTMIASAKGEYFAMVGIVFANLPLLYLMNREWYAALMHTEPGRIVVAICGAIILITGLLMSKYTKPIRYEK